MGLKDKTREKLDALLTAKVEKYCDAKLLPICYEVAKSHGCVLEYEDFLVFVRNGMQGVA